GGRGGVEPIDAFGGDGEGAGGVAEFAGAGEDVGEGVAGGVDGEAFAFAGRDGDVEVDRVGGDAGDGTFFAPERAADDAGLRAVVVGDIGDFGRFDFLVMRGGHLERGGEIGPQLEAVHAARFVALGHFLVDDAAAGGHPLDVACFDGAVVADAVGVIDGAGEDGGDGFDAALGMPGEAGEVVGGDVVAEIVQQQEGVDVGG